MHRTLATAALVTASLLYTAVRYIIFKGVPTGDIPFYVSNKAIALAALLLIGASVAVVPLVRAFPKHLAGWTGSEKLFGTIGVVLALLHAIVSLVILSPDHYGDLFHGGVGVHGLNWRGEGTVLFGLLGTTLPFLLLWTRRTPTRSPSGVPHSPPRKWPAILMLVFAAVHVLLRGYPGWNDWAHWPGHLPPITLISFIAAVAVFIILAALWRRGSK